MALNLVSWAFNAVDTIFSSRTTGPDDTPCPDGTAPFGYTMDGWKKWRTMCLGHVDVEDVEDVYLCVFLLTGLLAIGAGLWLILKHLRKIRLELTALKRVMDKRDRLMGPRDEEEGLVPP